MDAKKCSLCKKLTKCMISGSNIKEEHFKMLSKLMLRHFTVERCPQVCGICLSKTVNFHKFFLNVGVISHNQRNGARSKRQPSIITVNSTYVGATQDREPEFQTSKDSFLKPWPKKRKNLPASSIVPTECSNKTEISSLIPNNTYSLPEAGCDSDFFTNDEDEL